MKTYYIKTFGCQMNVSDSERIAGFLEKSPSNSPFCKGRGFKPAKNIREADLVIFNTCGVRQSAEDRVYGQMHNIKIKNQNAKFKIILTGCLANRKDVQRRLKRKVDLFTEIKDFPKKVLSIMYKVSGINNKKKSKIHNTLYKIHNTPNEEYLNNYFKIKPKYNSKFSAYIPIMTGCNNFCSYCVVPYARGREISRPADEIIKEVESLVKKGYKEIVLLGQNVNSYKGVISNSQLVTCKKNPSYKLPITNYINFSQLLRKINDIPGDFWIHFLTSHPKDMSDELIETIAKCEKVCEYVHLPIQAGDDEILRRMNRVYTTKHYLKIIDKIRKSFVKFRGKLVPISVSTDIIVGFPGETRKQFLKSAEIMKKVKYDMAYFGQYSPRPGTTAWRLKDNISKKEKEGREKYLNEIIKKTSLGNNKKYLGKIVDILVTHAKSRNNTGNLSRERLPKEKEGIIEYFGRTRTMKNIKFISNKKNLVGKFVKVKIAKANIWNLEGILSQK